jgi:hypothetical protein
MPSVGVSLPEGQRRESGSTPKHNLPAQRTAFVGREPEILEVKRQLAMTRLLTLTGAAASGRTRLALEVAQDLVGAYPGGVWLVELAPLSEEALVLQAVAKAVKVPEQPGRPLTDALVDALREKRLLLILDNREHLKEEGPACGRDLQVVGVGEWQPTSTRPSWNAEPRLAQEENS